MKTYRLEINLADPGFAPYRKGQIEREIEFKKQVLPSHGYDRLIVYDIVTRENTVFRLFGKTWVEERDWRAMLRDG